MTTKTNLILLSLLILILTACPGIGNSFTPSQALTDPEDNTSRKVKIMMSKMSLEDKIGEMTQLSLDMLCVGEPYNLQDPIQLDTSKMQKVLVDLKVGSIFNNGGHALTRKQWNEIISEIQRVATKEKTTGIPVLYGIDAIHGANYTVDATLFPQQIGLAATWNRDLVKQLASISAYETRASSIPWSFSPVLDLGCDPRWSRFWETFGEDPYLVSEMGKAVLQGTQGNDVSHPEKVASCMKHFLGYSFPLSGKDRTSAWIPERQLREYFLPSFQAAIDAGAKTIMINSGDINGIPVHSNSKILKDILRDELGFKGIAVTDWEDIIYLVSRHKIANDYKDAIRIAINAGIDMSMVSLDVKFPILLKELVEEGMVPVSRIDEAVSRILTLKFELGLFENPVPDFNTYPDFASEKFRQKALQAALESMTLLKNENFILPLSKKNKILVTGPTAHSLNALNGSWTHTWQGVETKYNTKGKFTILEAMQTEFGKSQITYVPGTSIDTIINIKKAVEASKLSDIAVICIGEYPYTEKPGDIDDMTLPDVQLQLVQEIAATGIPIVLVLVEGRPRIISEIESFSAAILMAYLPGDEGGIAIAKTISGENNPSGKLPFTYPRYVNSMIPYYYKGTDEIDQNFGTNAINPQWQFGYGLSYTSYEYKNLTIENLGNGEYSISVEVTNTGNQKGIEIIQLFVRDKVASIAPPVKRLRAFQKTEIGVDETKKYSFSITSADLKFIDKENNWITEAGEFEVIIGTLREPFYLNHTMNQEK